MSKTEKKVSDGIKKKSNEVINPISKQKIFDNQLKERKDGKGNPIEKKKKQVKKGKYHAYWKDELKSGEELANVVEIESFKKYNREDSVVEEEEEEQPTKEVKVEEEIKPTKELRCCVIF